MRERAQEMGALQVLATVEVTGLDVEDGRIRRVRTSGGDIEAETVVIAAGVWSPKLAAMAGARIPLTPAVHQMISVGPIPELADRPGEISYPIVRDMDTFCYERQHGSDMEVGSYAHRAILHDPEEIPSIEQAALSPTELPFTSDDFDPQLEQAFELMPEALGADGAAIRYAINGLLSLTPDGAPILGETPEVKGLWSRPRCGSRRDRCRSRVAEWMTDGNPEIDLSHSDIARFYPHQTTRAHIRARTGEAFNKTYGIVHPGEQWSSDRNKRLAPMHAAQQQQGAVFFEAVGWERPFWYASNESLLGDYGAAVLPREHEWDSRWWSPIINAEHLAMRERAGIVDLTAFSIFDVVGPRAMDAVQRLVVAQADVPAGRVIYSPVLDARGGFRSDLTVMRLAHDRYRVVTGGAHGEVDRKWFADRMPADGSASVVDQTSAFTTVGIWGPRARDILGVLTDADISHEGFGFGRCREIEVDTLSVLASRISYVGELGWELYVPMEQGARLWDLLHEAGRPHGAVPVGIGVYATTGRLEKGYRAFGYELDSERTIVEAGMTRPKVKDADFVGREAYLKQPGVGPRSGALHAQRRRPHLLDRRQAIHARRRADPEPGRRAAGRRPRPPAVRHQRRVRSLAGQAPADGVPAAGHRRGRHLAERQLHGGAVPGHGGGGRRHTAVRPGQRADQGVAMTNVLVCIKRVPGTSGEILLSDDGQSVDARHVGWTVSAHEEAPSSSPPR
jgi:glycine cleavage system aminomethyltransferase T